LNALLRGVVNECPQHYDHALELKLPTGREYEPIVSGFLGVEATFKGPREQLELNRWCIRTSLIEKRLGEFRKKVKADAFVGADSLPPQPQVADVADRQARLFRKEMDLFENYNADSRGFLILRHDVAEATDVARTVRSARTKRLTEVRMDLALVKSVPKRNTYESLQSKPPASCCRESSFLILPGPPAIPGVPLEMRPETSSNPF
jgi:hypothetical protein